MTRQFRGFIGIMSLHNCGNKRLTFWYCPDLRWHQASCLVCGEKFSITDQAAEAWYPGFSLAETEAASRYLNPKTSP